MELDPDLMMGGEIGMTPVLGPAPDVSSAEILEQFKEDLMAQLGIETEEEWKASLWSSGCMTERAKCDGVA